MRRRVPFLHHIPQGDHVSCPFRERNPVQPRLLYVPQQRNNNTPARRLLLVAAGPSFQPPPWLQIRALADFRSSGSPPAAAAAIIGSRLTRRKTYERMKLSCAASPAGPAAQRPPTLRTLYCKRLPSCPPPPQESKKGRIAKKKAARLFAGKGGLVGIPAAVSCCAAGAAAQCRRYFLRLHRRHRKTACVFGYRLPSHTDCCPPPQHYFHRRRPCHPPSALWPPPRRLPLPSPRPPPPSSFAVAAAASRLTELLGKADEAGECIERENRN